MADESIVPLLDVSPPTPAAQYLVARETEWNSDRDLVTVWRGPEKPDEHLPRMRLRPIECETLRVTKAGFWDCEEIFEDLEDEVEKASETLIEDWADRDQAITWSYPESYQEDFGPEVFITATFGDWTAVNGEIRHDIHPPRGYVLTDRGGRIPVSEAEIQKEDLYDLIHQAVQKAIARPIPMKKIKAIVDKLHPKRYIYSGGSGESEVWVSKKAMKAHEEEKERRLQRSRLTPEQLETQKEIRRLERERRAEEHRQQIRDAIARGEYGAKQDWSPRGEIPGREI